MLSKQGPCWSCRRLGYCGADSVCPNKKNKDEDGKKKLNVMQGHVLAEELKNK